MRSSSKITLVATLALSLWILSGCTKTDPTAPKDSTIDLSANPSSLTLDVGETGHSTLTATVLDADGVPVSGIPVHFSSTSGHLSSGGDGIKTNSNGEARDTLTLQAGDDDATVKARAAGTAAGTITVGVNAPGENAGPTATITPSPVSVTPGTPFTVSGATSRDTDGTIVRYDWDMGDGAAGVFPNNTVPTKTYTYATAGTFTISLTVYDDGDHVGCDTTTHLCTGTKSATTTVTANVGTAAPVAVISNGATFSVQVNTSVTLDGTPSHDSDGSIVRYDWTFGDATPGVTTTTPTTTHTWATTGSFTVGLTVWDNGDGTACDGATHLCHGSKSGTTSSTVTVTP